MKIKILHYAFLCLFSLTGFTGKIIGENLGQLRSGETRSGSINPVGESDTFTFNGDAGDTVIIIMTQTDGWSLSEYLELYDPDGYLEKSAYNSISDYKLLKSGIYTLICRDRFNDDTGNYNISFIKIPGSLVSTNDLDGGDIIPGYLKKGKINLEGDMDGFNFYGEMGETVIINLVQTDGWSLSEYLELYDPDGYLEKSAYNSISDYQLLKSGIYTLICRDRFNDDTGNYNILFMKIPGPLLSPNDRDGGDVISGDVKQGKIGDEGDMDGFNFYGEMGEIVTFEMSQTDGWSLSEYLELYDPDGYLEKSAYNSISDYQLLKSGIYTLICRDRFNDDTGQYSLYFTKIPPSIPPGVYDPSPLNGQEVPSTTTTALEWYSNWAVKYDVYFGTNVLVPLQEIHKGITNSFCLLPPLEKDTTYYWRIVARKDAEEKPGPVWMFIARYLPEIDLSKTSLSFKGTEGETNLFPQTFKIRNSGDGELNYTITADQTWIDVMPKSGSSSGEWDEITVTVNISSFSEGEYSGVIKITSENALNSAQEIGISLKVEPPPIFPPLKFSGAKRENRWLFRIEYINNLNWQANPANRNIEKYRIYLKEGENYSLLAEVGSYIFSYHHRGVDREKEYIYALIAVDYKDREGEPAFIGVK